jgi:acyl dehydratase
VPVDSRLRGRIRLLSADRLPDQGWQISIELTVEREGSERPVCIAESISRRYA